MPSMLFLVNPHWSSQTKLSQPLLGDLQCHLCSPVDEVQCYGKISAPFLIFFPINLSQLIDSDQTTVNILTKITQVNSNSFFFLNDDYIYQGKKAVQNSSTVM